jgi:enoyl-[acyl-carrier protein] reductase III
MNVLVTGGSRGIGRAISMRLAEKSAQHIFIVYLENDRAAEKTKRQVEAGGVKCSLIKANLAQAAELDRVFEAITSQTERLDAFIHCAALGSFKPLSQIKPNQWDLTMNVNARAFLHCAQRCVPLMKEGRIVAISSLGSQRVMPNYGAMGPTKSALESIVKYLAVEMAPSGIRVNGVSGGLVRTESVEKFSQSRSLLREVAERTPAKRIGTVEDIADVVAFLVGPMSSWIYGQIIVADGGLSLL